MIITSDSKILQQFETHWTGFADVFDDLDHALARHFYLQALLDVRAAKIPKDEL